MTDAKKKFDELLKSADAGNSDAMLLLAIAYKNGQGTQKDDAQFFLWMKKAAKEGNSDAMFALALAYKNGQGTKKDDAQFFIWMKKSADAGNSDAMAALAIAYEDGQGTQKDDAQYFIWMKKAAEADNSRAMFALAFAYKNGQGTQKDMGGFYKWIQKANEKGVIIALTHGWSCLRNTGITPRQLDSIVKETDNLYNLVQTRKGKHLITQDNAKDGVAHFTGLPVLQKLLEKPSEKPKEGEDIPPPKPNRMRLYNIVNMNDPDEGMALFNVDKKENGPLHDLFPSASSPSGHHFMQWNEDEYSVYAGCFSLQADRLDLWRAYAKDGDGYCLVTPVSAFGDSKAHNMDTSSFLDPSHSRKVETGTGKDAYKPFLYRVEYTEEETKKAYDEIKPTLEKIKDLMKGLPDKAKKIVRETVHAILLDILYLFKDEQYASEKEARIITVLPVTDPQVRLDSGDGSRQYRLYTETEPFFFKHPDSKIIIGPTVEDRVNAEQLLKYLLREREFLKNVSVRHSVVHYRRWSDIKTLKKPAP